jgi:hypothetical protein
MIQHLLRSQGIGVNDYSLTLDALHLLHQMMEEKEPGRTPHGASSQVRESKVGNILLRKKDGLAKRLFATSLLFPQLQFRPQSPELRMDHLFDRL